MAAYKVHACACVALPAMPARSAAPAHSGMAHKAAQCSTRLGVTSTAQPAGCATKHQLGTLEMPNVAAGAVLGIAIGAFLMSSPTAVADFLSYDHADMRGADLSEQDLRGAVFAACDCRQINLQGSNLDGTTDTFAGFQNANLENTSWVRALADRVVFRSSNLRNANFTSAILSGSQFDDADITGADFTEAIVDKSQRLKMCRKAEGVNPVTGVETRESLFC